MTDMIDILKRGPVIPVIVIDRLSDALPLASALVEGGLKVLEVTLRTSVAIEAVSQIKQAFPDVAVGTGTVTDMSTLRASIEVGADFMVSPGVTSSLLRAAVAEGVNLLPGASTPSEAMHLLEEGYLCQKFFPAEAAGGIEMLKALAGPLPQITFCPTGGISLESADRYLELANVACVGGTWMLNKKMIEKKDWSGIKKLAQQASMVGTTNNDS
ncbi:bifunctional 4-hydroxy-2-oxoglutarate aldolase/2-dehydro-3-deoxy-phosphogluconate aldolase [Aliikangiella coralliicola]|uniref:2-dehydro-3-deoxy-phosphogluconate aldolase n=1 Tax=Aliikangiella coralliicola TaxID=2592383 RepID=A0A545UJQ5_9GAMM|nr:bifunctional 4-hydroxy-2-oxoglutarate aldolase/2-dehydro-3-deoxy-phosphogluconate aldolase [Aliikangiella coralliicola]TQV89691.1 bifunctional 4-hydroxy-2-oxoglutarate aldolase/2-dehydro-3-deoxy-phosphogluconate aldolase [Aliikangiella coralliicola]